MGTSLDRALRIRDSLESSVRSMIAETIHFKLSHAEFLEKRAVMVFDHVFWSKAPRWVQSYVEGYERASIQQIEIMHEWRLKFRGRWLKSEAGGATGEGSTSEIPSGNWWEITLGNHFWRDSDKPWGASSDCGISDPKILKAYLDAQLKSEGHIYCAECGEPTKNVKTRLCKKSHKGGK